jgi:hypothetical protein
MKGALVVVQICDTLLQIVAPGPCRKRGITEPIGVAACRVMALVMFNWEGMGEFNRQ